MIGTGLLRFPGELPRVSPYPSILFCFFALLLSTPGNLSNPEVEIGVGPPCKNLNANAKAAAIR